MVEGCFAWFLGGLSGLLSGSWVASRGVLEGLGEVLGVMLAPKMAAKSKRYRTKCGSKRQAVPEKFFDGFLVEDKQPGGPNSVFELGNPNVKCISAFSAQTQSFVRVGCQHGPMLSSKIPENRGPGDVRASFGRR